MTRRKFVILSALISAVVIALPFVCNETLQETYYTVRSEKVSSPMKIAFISDLHSSFYGKDMCELEDSVDAFSPDIVVFGGDLFDKVWGEENSVTLVKKLVAKYDCYYSVGNHEIRTGYDPLKLVKSEMRNAGVTVLDGQYTDIGDIRLSGIDGWIYADQLDPCIASISPDKFNILIDHFPEEFPRLSKEGFDLILSGHAHGGQIRLPLILPNGLYSPGEGLFPKYTGGEYFMDGSEMIVSRGLFRKMLDLIAPRVFNRPEVVYITVTK